MKPEKRDPDSGPRALVAAMAALHRDWRRARLTFFAVEFAMRVSRITVRRRMNRAIALGWVAAAGWTSQRRFWLTDAGWEAVSGRARPDIPPEAALSRARRVRPKRGSSGPVGAPIAGLDAARPRTLMSEDAIAALYDGQRYADVALRSTSLSPTAPAGERRSSAGRGTFSLEA